MNKKTKIKKNNHFFNLSILISNKTYLLLILTLLLTFGIYSNSFQNKFLSWDDDLQITANKYVKNYNGNFFTSLYKLDKHTSFTLLSYAIDYKLWKKNPLPYHVENVLLHLLNILLVFIFIKAIFKNQNVAFICALLFALHPSRVESVAWIAERKDLLFTFFSLLSLLSYIKYLNNKKTSDNNSAQSFQNLCLFFLVILLSYLAGLSKIQAVTLPILFFILDFYFDRKTTLFSVYEKFFLIFLLLVFDPGNLHKFVDFMSIISTTIFLFIFYFFHTSINKTIRYFLLFFALFTVLFSKQAYLLWPFFIWFGYENYLSPIFKNRLSFKNYLFLNKYRNILFAIGILFCITLFLIFQNKFGFWQPQNNPTFDFNFIDRFFLGSYAFIFYLFLFIFPFNLNAIHPYPAKIDGFLPVEYYLSFTVVILLIITFIYFLINKKIKLNRNIIFCLLFFLVNISLVLHIIPIQGRLVAADRYSYIAFIGLFAVIAFLLEEYKNRFAKLFAKTRIIFLLILFSYAAYTFLRIDVWKDSISLFTNITDKNPEIAFAQCNLGAVKMAKGKKEEILYHLNKAISLDTTLLMAYYNRAIVYYQFHEYEKSIKDLNWLLKKQKDSTSIAISYNDIAMVKFDMGDITGAKADIERSILYYPSYSKPHNTRGRIKCIEGNYDGSIADFNKAINIDPEMDDAYVNRGWSMALKGMREQSLNDFKKAIDINPENEKAYANLGTMKINQKDIKGAIADLNKAIEINPNFESAYRNRAYAYYISSDFSNCINDYTRAISMNPTLSDLYRNRGWAYYFVKDYRNALKDYNIAAELSKEDDMVFANRGWIKYQMHDTLSAISDFNKAISLNKNSEKGYLFRGISLFYKKKYNEALIDLNVALKNKNKNTEAHYYIGLCYLILKKHNEACESFNTALKLGYIKAQEIIDKNCKLN